MVTPRSTPTFELRVVVGKLLQLESTDGTHDSVPERNARSSIAFTICRTSLHCFNTPNNLFDCVGTTRHGRTPRMTSVGHQDSLDMWPARRYDPPVISRCCLQGLTVLATVLLSACGSGPTQPTSVPSPAAQVAQPTPAPPTPAAEPSATQPTQSASLAALSVDPSFVGGSTARGIVTLTGPAPTGGLSVALSSSNPAVSVPATVTVPAGQTEVAFGLSSQRTTSMVTLVVTASRGDVTLTAPVQLRVEVTPPTPVATLSALAVDSSFVSGSTSRGTVTLTGPAPTGGTTVSLSVNNSAAQVPSTVTVSAGQSEATFTIGSQRVNSSVSVVVTARLDDTVRTATMELRAVVTLSSVTVDSSFVGGATGRGSVSLTGAAPSGGLSVTLSSDNSAAQVPSTVTVASGATQASFSVISQRVSRTTDLVITARTSDATRTAPVRLRIDPSTLQPTSNVTLSLSGLGANQTPVSRYSEAGFTLTASGADWYSASYGRPGPALHFQVGAGVRRTGEVRITTDNGAPFWLTAADFYSSTTPIPYEFEGFLSGQSVYRVTGQLGNTFGNFATAQNTQSAVPIDLLIVRLTNPAATCCSNPVGIDNIALQR